MTVVNLERWTVERLALELQAANSRSAGLSWRTSSRWETSSDGVRPPGSLGGVSASRYGQWCRPMFDGLCVPGPIGRAR